MLRLFSLHEEMCHKTSPAPCFGATVTLLLANENDPTECRPVKLSKDQSRCFDNWGILLPHFWPKKKKKKIHERVYLHVVSDASQVCGSVTEMKWTPDGRALAMSWQRGGFALWSVFGTLLHCTAASNTCE